MTAADEPAVEAATHRVDPFAYRPDIDGLRALAVTAVVLFHAGLTAIPGGFVGVDVFFVISGYLIGGHIFGEVGAGVFTFAGFYTRRVRRIMPALFAMLICGYVAALTLLTPEELRELGKESTATVLAVSNWLFYSSSGYFEPAAELKPLLNTWSLGVEEQFYVIFPLVAIGLFRLSRRAALITLAGVCILSFAGSLVLLRLDPTAAFYLPPTRAWELGIGTLLAWRERRAGVTASSPSLGLVMSGAGVLLIGVALFAYRPSFGFPGAFAALPSIATALVIAARGSALNRAVFSSAPVVLVGRVSYSWYLWHWPLFYVNRVVGNGAGGAHPVVLVLASFALGVLSWRLVEQPLRQRTLPPRVALLHYLAAGAAVAVGGLVLYAHGGWPERLSPSARRLAAQARSARSSPCLAPLGTSALRNLGTCAPAEATGRSALVVLGDSHASALAPGLRQLAAENGLAFGELTKASCPALFAFAPPDEGRLAERARCIAYQRRAFAWLDANPKVRIVVLASYWSSEPEVSPASGPRQSLAQALDATVVRLQRPGRQVVLVQDAPTFRFDPYAESVGDLMPLRAALAQALQGKGRRGGVASLRDVIPDLSRSPVAAVARRRGVTLLDLAPRLCDAGGCRFRDPDDLFYFDFQHLTAPGAVAALRGAALPRP